MTKKKQTNKAKQNKTKNKKQKQITHRQNTISTEFTLLDLINLLFGSSWLPLSIGSIIESFNMRTAGLFFALR